MFTWLHVTALATLCGTTPTTPTDTRGEMCCFLSVETTCQGDLLVFRAFANLFFATFERLKLIFVVWSLLLPKLASLQKLGSAFFG